MANEVFHPDRARRAQERADECARLRAAIARSGTDISPELLRDLELFLQDCQQALLAMAEWAYTPRWARSVNRVRRALETIDARLWPRVLESLKAKDAQWADELAALSSVWDASTRRKVVMVRSLVEALHEQEADAGIWSELAVFAREILSPRGVQVELIRDPRQPAEWFEPPTEVEVAQPTVTEVGLAVRCPPGSWVPFPKGRLIIPLAPPPWPAGLRELLDAVSDPSDVAEVAIRRRLEVFAAAAQDGSLDVAAVQFYVDFWGELGTSWREHASERAAEFTSRLYYFLQHALRLFPFSPETYQDFPDGWLQRSGGRGMVTGRVRRVLRPGLQDDQNQLRLPALVEVE